jgi:hypothetical protein
MAAVRAGDRFVTTREIPSMGVTHWRTPITRGFYATVPDGTVLVASAPSAKKAEAFYCRPEGYRELEALLVPEADRRADGYDGYSLVFPIAEIDASLRRL